MAVTETIWCGFSPNKLYANSGQFTTTVRDSLSIPLTVQDNSWDGTNTPWCASSNKLFLQSGKFSSTLKSSISVAAIGNIPLAIDADSRGNTPWAEFTAPVTLFLQSGQFSSTVKTSLNISSFSTGIHGISLDTSDTFLCGFVPQKLYNTSGQFTTTIKTSVSVLGNDADPSGGVYDGENAPWCGDANDKFFLQSGYFSSTIKTSLSVSSINTVLKGIDVDDYLARQGLVLDLNHNPNPGGGGGRPATSRGRILTARGDRKLREKIDTAAMSRAIDIIFREVEQEKAVEKARQEDQITQIIRETIRFEHQQRGVKEQLKALEELRGDMSNGMKDLEALIALLLARLL